MAQAASIKGLSPESEKKIFSEPCLLDAEIAESAVAPRPPVLISLIADPTPHPGWTDRKTGVVGKFRLPKGLIMGAQFLRGKLGGEFTLGIAGRF